MSDKVLGMAGEEVKSMSHEVKGMWTDEVCA